MNLSEGIFQSVWNFFCFRDWWWSNQFLLEMFYIWLSGMATPYIPIVFLYPVLIGVLCLFFFVFAFHPLISCGKKEISGPCPVQSVPISFCHQDLASDGLTNVYASWYGPGNLGSCVCKGIICICIYMYIHTHILLAFFGLGKSFIIALN